MGADIAIGSLAALRRSGRLRRPACRLHGGQGRASSARCPAASSASPSMPAATAPIACRCRPANSTSAAKRRRRTSAPRRCCSPSWPRCTPSSTARRASRRSPSSVHQQDRAPGQGPGKARLHGRAGDLLRHDHRRCRPPAGRHPASAPSPRASTCARSAPTKIGISARRAHAAGNARSCLARLRRQLRRSPISSRDYPPAERPAAHQRIPDASDLPHEPRRKRDDPLHPPALRPRPGARPLDDPARLLHDEAQRDRRDAADHLAGILRHPSLRAGRSGARLPRDDRRPDRKALRHHRLRRRLDAAELRRAGRIRRPADHPRLPHRRARRTATSA